MGNFLGSPKIQYFDSNGDPLVGGLLYSYEVGTTTEKATYPTIADADNSTNANANPVVLDSRGEANVVLQGATKLVLKGADGTTIWTVDNITENTGLVDSNGNTVLSVAATASAVNYVEITNAAAGNGPQISVAGTDNNINLLLTGKGSGRPRVIGGSLQIVDTEGVEDEDGNEQLLFTKTASAVNYLNITNAATGTNSIIGAAGDDTNIGVDFQGKGTGTYNFKGTADQAAYIRIFEDTDNGSNYIELRTPASIASNKNLTFQDLSGTIGIEATQAAMEAETDEFTYVTPDLVRHSPGVAKFWASFNGTGTAALNTSYNVTSLTDNGTGDYTITIADDFSSADWVFGGLGEKAATDDGVIIVMGGATYTQAAGTVRFYTKDTDTNFAIDPTDFWVWGWGDQ